MQIENSFTISEAERMVRELDGRATDTALLLPTKSRAHAAGGEPAMAQAVLTWATAQHRAVVGTYAADADDRQAGRITRHLVGLVAALTCDEARDAGGRAITDELRDLAVDRLKGLQGVTPQDWSRGPQVEIVCADHLGRPTPETLYASSEPGKRLRSRVEFNDVADLVLRETVPVRTDAPSDEQLRTGLADLLYELFRNTDEYARPDGRAAKSAGDPASDVVAVGDGAGSRKSVRAVHARRHAVSGAALAGMVANSPPLAAYCDRLRARDGRANLQLLETSVIDTGPGYASHWLRRPLSEITPDEELKAIATCFEKHASRKDDKSAGMGLCTVVDILRQRNGFMRLRTGRQSLYADLGQQADSAFGEPPRLSPWLDRRLPPVAGTIFTFILPI